MAIYHLTAKTGSRSGGQSAAAHADYIAREGQYERGDDDDVVHRESGHMPDWAQADPRTYWAAADEHERANGRLFRDIEFALPKELSERQQVALAREFSASVTTGTGERLPYTLAVHHGEGENPHAHLMFSERANDGIARSAEQWFRRHNSKAPDQGGAKKSEATKPKAWLEQTRASWAEQANRALARAGCPEQIHAGSLAQQLTEAEHRGDADAIARLAHREPGVHLGPHNLARVERGESLERVAEVGSVEDRNQALAAERADVSRMEQALQHVRDEIAKAVKALADYAREYWDRTARSSSRGSGTTSGGPADGECLGSRAGGASGERGAEVERPGDDRGAAGDDRRATGPEGGAEVASASHQTRAGAGAGPKRFRRELVVCAVVAVGATLITLVTVLVLGTSSERWPSRCSTPSVAGGPGERREKIGGCFDA